MQDRPAPPYLLALVALTADEAALGALAQEVARDVAREGPGGGGSTRAGDATTPAAGDAGGAAAVDAARAALDWLIASLRAGPLPSAVSLRTLREEAASEARAGRPLQPVLDRALSAGWVLWGWVAARRELSADGLRALGDALLRTGDAAAAAIADGHAAAERELATRSASALRELLDELLDLASGDEAGRARLLRRAGELAIPVDRPLTVIVADAGHDVQDGDPEVVSVARRLAPGGAPVIGDPRSLGGLVPSPVVAAARGRLVVLVPAGRRAPDVAGALGSLGTAWVAASADAGGLLDAGGAAREATAALAVARRAGRRGSVIPAASLALERALLAEPALLRAAVDRELGPRHAAPRSAGLVETLEAFLAERENVRAAARRLGVAPRTVAYRLERIERILGAPLDAERRLRLATALFARGVLGDGRDADAAPSVGRTPTARPGAGRRAAAGPPR